MMDDIRAGTYTGLICWHPDRLARNMKDAGELIDMLDRGILKALKFPSYQFINDANGLMTLGLQFLLAKLYSDNLSESVNRGNRGVIGDGKSIGNKLLHGYKKVNGRMRKDGKNYALIKQAFQMGLNKATQDEIATYLNEQGYSRDGKKKELNFRDISNLFKDPSYTGIYRYGINVVDFSEVDPLFEPAISHLDFLKLRQIIDGKRSFGTKNAKTIIFSKMVFCGHCGNLMSAGKPKGNSYRYLTVRCTKKDCPSGNVRGMREVRGLVIFEFMYQLFQDGLGVSPEAYQEYENKAKDILSGKVQDLKTKILNLQRQLAETAKTIELQTHALVKAEGKTIDEINAKIAELRDSQTSIEDKISELKNQLIDVDQLRHSSIMSYENFLNFFENMDTWLKNNENRYLTDKIIRMVFLNFAVKDKKVLKYQLNPHFESIAKLPSILQCRGDRTRTCDLTLPKRAL